MRCDNAAAALTRDFAGEDLAGEDFFAGSWARNLGRGLRQAGGCDQGQAEGFGKVSRIHPSDRRLKRGRGEITGLPIGLDCDSQPLTSATPTPFRLVKAAVAAARNGRGTIVHSPNTMILSVKPAFLSWSMAIAGIMDQRHFQSPCPIPVRALSPVVFPLDFLRFCLSFSNDCQGAKGTILTLY